MMEPTAELSARLGFGAGAGGLSNMRHAGEELGLRIYKTLNFMGLRHPDASPEAKAFFDEIEERLVRPSGI